MAFTTSHNKLGKDICDALGLKHVRQLQIIFPVDGMVTLYVEMYPEIDGVKQFPAIFKKFELTEKKQEGEAS